MTLSPSVNHPKNCGSPTAAFARTFAKRPRSARRFDLAVEQVGRVSVPGSSSSVTVRDRQVTRSTGATVVSDFSVTPYDVSGKTTDRRYQASSDDPSVVTVEDTGAGYVARFQSAGSTVVRVSSGEGETQSVAITATSSTGGTTDTFAGWSSGSLARHMWDQVVNRFSGLSPIAATVVPMLSVFGGVTTTYDYTYRSSPLINLFEQWPGNTHVVGTGLASGHQNPDGPWVRSESHWLADVDLTCISGWNQGSNGVVRATMVSPEHWVCCKHGWEPKTGDTLWFIGQAGEVSTHTVTSTVNVDGADIRVGRISPALPEYISFAKVLPKNCRSRLPGFSWAGAVVPAFKINQDFQALVVGTTVPYSDSTRRPWGGNTRTLLGDLEPLKQFTNEIRFLDSGNPTFVLVNGEAVLVSVHSSVLGGPFFSDDGIGNPSPLSPIYDLVNAAMTALGGGYQLTDVDISSFPTYS